MNRRKELFWTVLPQDEGRDLQDFLAQCLKMSRRAAKHQIDGKTVWINDRCVWMARHRLKRGDIVRVTGQVASPTARSSLPRKLVVLFEDDHFIAVDKPAGIVSNASDRSAEALLRVQTGNSAIAAIHRLDRNTTGCLLLAKRERSREAAIEVFRRHDVSKTYRTIVHNRWDAKSTTLDLPIEEERARTNVTCLRATEKASYLLVRIETGRTHQIRRHLAMARHPVMGDRQYGPKELENPELQLVERPLLHAAELQLEHPFREGSLKIFAPLPDDFHRWLGKLKLDRR
jgi:RluA family pseudouridine synthase